MRRFVLRKLALFDWINHLEPSDRTIAYRIYTLLDHIRLSKKMAFVIALPFLFLPFLVTFVANQIQPNLPLPHIPLLMVLACLCYGGGYFALTAFVLNRMRSKWITELQQMFFLPDASRVLDRLIPLDTELESQTHLFPKPTKPRFHRRARHPSA